MPEAEKRVPGKVPECGFALWVRPYSNNIVTACKIGALRND